MIASPGRQEQPCPRSKPTLYFELYRTPTQVHRRAVVNSLFGVLWNVYLTGKANEPVAAFVATTTAAAADTKTVRK